MMSIPDLAVETAHNSSFSKIIPGLQHAIDSTSLGEYKVCPRKYYYGVIRGFRVRTESVHLIFGIIYHEACERYDHGRSSGLSHEDSVRLAVHHTLRRTWNPDLARPWSSDHNTKNRLTLVRTVVWYLDQFGAEDPVETVQLANGKPAVELSFSFPVGELSSTGEPITLCGHMDRVGELGGNLYVLDRKTTGHTLDPKFFSQFTPHNQFSLYALAGQIILDRPIAGIIVDAAQIAGGFSRFERQPIPRTKDQLEEWLADTLFWIRQMEHSALSGHWPQNDKNCDLYGGCPFRDICKRTPGAREAWLAANYTRVTWDPLQRRGDI